MFGLTGACCLHQLHKKDGCLDDVLCCGTIYSVCCMSVLCDTIIGIALAIFGILTLTGVMQVGALFGRIALGVGLSLPLISGITYACSLALLLRYCT